MKIKPNRHQSKTLVPFVTNEDLAYMFNNAKNQINDWTVRSTLNKGMSKGAAYNILKSVGDGNKHHQIAICNAIREFGEYLPDVILGLISCHKKRPIPDVFHEEPKFD